MPNFNDDCPPIRPLQAWRSLRACLHNPLDTPQILALTEALRGSTTWRLAQRMTAHPGGQKILQQRRSLPALLHNRAALERLPEGTLGHAYAAFIARQEQAHLNPSALPLFDGSHLDWHTPTTALSDRQYLTLRLRALHDVFHVLTGYGGDTLGEMCVLAFCYPQQRTRSFALLASLIGWQLQRNHTRGALRAVQQAWQHGRYAAWIPAQPIEDLLAENLTGLRARWRILPPTRYHAVLTHNAATPWIGHAKEVC